MKLIAVIIKLCALVVAAILLSCLMLGGTKSAVVFAQIEGGFEVDSVPPATVFDLSIATRTSNSITLTWTAPGDDINTGTASSYDIRYATVEIGDANWDSITQCSGEPIPSMQGSSETFTVTSLSDNATYYFALKTADEALNWSGISNVAIGTTITGAPVLSGGVVSPSSGNTSSIFSYSVKYTDFENEAPSSITVSIDSGTPENMSARIGQDGNFINGEIYEYNVNGAGLGVGVHTFLFSASDGISSAVGDVVSHSGPSISSPPGPVPSSGGGGSGGGGGVTKDSRITSLGSVIGWDGTLWDNIEALSLDGKLQLQIPIHTIALNRVGVPLNSITIVTIEDPNVSQEYTKIVGFAYELKPAGATFNPPITATFKYDPMLIPAGLAEENLVVAFYDADNDQWVDYPCDINPDTNIITTKLSHFSIFAILARNNPAYFTTTEPVITPDKVNPKENVTISTVVTNTGDLTGSYQVLLKIDSVEVATQDIELAGCTSKTVTFTVNRDVDGSYEAEINGQRKTFIVSSPPEISLGNVSTVTDLTTMASPTADFAVTDFAISPIKAKEGETVVISAIITNSGKVEGTYTSALIVNGITEQVKEITLAPGDKKLLNFEVTREKAGVYNIEVCGQRGEFTLSSPLFTSNRLLLVLSIMTVLVGIIVALNRSWLMSRLQLIPGLAILHNPSYRSNRKTPESYPLPLQVEPESTAKLVKVTKGDPLESAIVNNYRVWLLNQLEKSKKIVEPEIKGMFESYVQKECKAWLSDQWHKHELLLFNQADEGDRLITAEMIALFKQQILKGYQEWIRDQLEKGKQSLVAKMLTMFVWQVKSDFQEWLLNQSKDGEKLVDSTIQDSLEQQVTKDFQGWLSDYLEGTESSIGVKMLTLLDDSFIIHSEKTFGYDFSKIQQ